MELLIPTLNQMLCLVAFIAVGYLLARFGAVKSEAAGMLSKLENVVFIPALMMGTFMSDFSVASLAESWKLIAFSTVVELVFLPISLLIGRKCSKVKFEQNICAYGLAFSNFGYMGHAVVRAIFPEYFGQYVMFTMPLYIIIYMWAVPTLLIPGDGRQTWKQRLKAFFNPMLIGVLVGMVVGLSGIKLPSFVSSVVNTAGDCMSPIAMILTGITIASIDLSRVLRSWNIYIVTVLRLLVYPLVAMAALMLLPLPEVYVLCAVCALAMPLGLSNVVIPAAYGMDTTKAAAMALVSHLLSVLTIPVMFILLKNIL
ncbi:MAG: AEC family transporter [Clostridia bacterium]|nr:AEC family transporter [Clostridia bacterium]